MTAQTPAVWTDGESHPAEDIRRSTTFLAGGRAGVFGQGLAVTENTTPDLQVKVAGGAAIVAGDAAFQGHYFVENRGDALVTLSAGPSAGLERWDLITLRVEDLGAGDSQTAFDVEAVEGTAAAIGSAVFPTLPASGSFFVLAAVLVPASATAITDAMITDIRDGSVSDGVTTLRNRGRAAAAGGIIVVENPAQLPTTPDPGVAATVVSDGSFRIADDGGVFQFVANRDYGRYTDWTPTITGWTLNPASDAAQYTRIGDHIECALFGEVQTTPTADLLVSLPVQAHADWRNRIGVGQAVAHDVTGALRYSGAVGITGSGNEAKVWPVSATGSSDAAEWDPAVPFTFAAGDTLALTWSYRAVGT